MHFNSIGIQITTNCNAACSMCCFSCDNSSGKTLQYSLIEKIILEAKEIENIDVIGFTGGEPFLKYELLYDSIKLSKYQGLSSIVTTNGSWAKNKIHGLKKIKELKSLGLKKISLSYDQFHEEFIDITTIQNAIDICKEAHLFCELGLCFIRGGKTPGYFIDMLGERVFNMGLALQPMIPIGRAVEVYKSEDFITNWSLFGMICPNKASKLSYFDVEGNFYPCCSQVVDSTLLTVGNIKNKSLKELLDCVRSNMYLFVLIKRGFDFYVDIIINEFNIKLKPYWVSPCELCHYIFSDYTLLKRLEPFVLSEVHKIIDEKRTIK